MARNIKFTKEQIEKALDELNEREKRIIQLRFGLEDGHPRTLEVVGKEFNLCRGRISQIIYKALGKLPKPLRDYLVEGGWKEQIMMLGESAEPKICPILMAGAMIRAVDNDVARPTRYHFYHDPIVCLGDKCEWFDNGCPAHPRLEWEYPISG